MSLQTHIILSIELKETNWEIFSPTNFIEQDSTENHLTLAKTARVSK